MKGWRTTEKRLIDANALNERFDKRIKWLRLDTHDQYSLGLYHGAATDKDLIGEMPTVDAVEVVRCKDCKHWLKDVPGCTDFVGRCEWANYMIGAVGYCVYGERRIWNSAD